MSAAEATALSTDKSTAENTTLSWGPQPHYFVLYVFSYAISEFLAVGVYTKRTDAEEHETRARAELGAKFSGAIAQRSHEEFCYEMADYRLGAIAEHIGAFMGKPPRRALYDRSAFPIAAAPS